MKVYRVPNKFESYTYLAAYQCFFCIFTWIAMGMSIVAVTNLHHLIKNESVIPKKKI